MSGLVQVLSVQRCSETESGASAELDVVCESGDATVVDLGLGGISLANQCLEHISSYLCKRAGVKLVLGGYFQTNIASCLRIPGRLGASLDLGIDLVVVAGGKDAQVVGGSDSSGI